ncbi:MAG: hypothetical protein WBN31_01090 [Gammaproteobacteria bacterium]
MRYVESNATSQAWLLWLIQEFVLMGVIGLGNQGTETLSFRLPHLRDAEEKYGERPRLAEIDR